MAKPTVADLAEQNRQLADNQELLIERLAELELGLEDIGYIRLSADSEREFSRGGLRIICTTSRYMYLKNPLINRAVEIQASYVFAQGVSVKATDPGVNDIIQAFWDDPANRAELTSHQSRLAKERELQVLGNLFFAFFINPATGAVRIRTIPVDEVSDIITNPEDGKEPWYYRRSWTQVGLDGAAEMRVAYYPDWRKPPAVTFTPGDGTVETTPVYHVKVGGLSDMRFGVPETYQALDWAKAYKEFLEDRATLARALSRFAWRLTTPGGKAGIAAAKTKLASTVNTSTTESNPPPVTGSTFIQSTGGANLDPIRTSGATINPEEGRRFLLMVCAAMGLPETFFGDVSVGTLATATSLDRPTELKMVDRRALWADILCGILTYVVERARGAPGARATADVAIDVDFPPLLEHDPQKRIMSIVSAATLDGKATAGTMDDRTLISLLLQTLGVDDIDELLDRIVPEGGESLMAQRKREGQEQAQAIADSQAAAARANQGEPPAGGNQESPPDQTATEALMVKAVEELREAIARATR